ncbi:hypothetical protein JHK86_045117 [Glycine max]|nr:hypothetical protein JHK86_045117 [Glycine max]
MGFCMRDHGGRLINAYSDFKPIIRPSIQEGEALALKEALLWLRDCGVEAITIESNQIVPRLCLQFEVIKETNLNVDSDYHVMQSKPWTLGSDHSGCKFKNTTLKCS